MFKIIDDSLKVRIQLKLYRLLNDYIKIAPKKIQNSPYSTAESAFLFRDHDRPDTIPSPSRP